MRRRSACLARLALVLGAACAGLSCATLAGRQSWLHVQSEHFDVLSSAPRERTREIVLELERFRAAVMTLAGIEAGRRGLPTRVYLFGDSRTFSRFRSRRFVAGFMQRHESANYIAVDASVPEQSIPIAYHEYVHVVLSSSPFSYPPWYQEGFAELLSTLEFEAGDVVLGRIPAGRAGSLLYGTPLSLQRVMTATEVRRWPGRPLRMFYAESWALTHFLHLGHFLGHPNRLGELVIYLDRVSGGLSPEEACVEAFGSSIAELERGFMRYMAGGRFGAGTLRVPQTAPQELVIEPVAPAEALYRLGDLALVSGPGRLDEAERLLEQAVAAGPRHARAHAGLAEVRLRRGDPDAERLFQLAIELGPDDAIVHRRRGDALLAQLAAGVAALPGPERSRLVEEARRHYLRSFQLDPDQAAALAGLGSTYLWDHAGAPEPGVELLEAALRLAPGSEKISLQLAQLYTKVGRDRSARELLGVALQQPHAEATEAGEALLQELLETTGMGAIVDDPQAHLEAQLELMSPEEGEVIRGMVALAEVRGHAGLGDLLFHDVVVAIDESGSTLAATGHDVDGDGRVGKRKWRLPVSEPRQWTTDFDDTIIRSELLAARELIRQLNPATTRVALLTFAADAVVRAPLGPPAEALTALEEYRVYLNSTGTSLAHPLGRSLEEFARRPDPEHRRLRTVLLLSDGQPTFPSQERGWELALRTANELGRYGVKVHAFALGRQAVERREAYGAIAEATDGRLVLIESPADVVNELADTRLTGLHSVEIRNRRLAAPARAVRVFADGSFDAYVPLAPGSNEIEARAVIDGHGELVTTRTVVYRPTQEPDEADRRDAAILLEELRARTVAVDMLAERRRAQAEAATTRGLELEVEE